MKTKQLVTSALLTALSLLIPIAFGGYLRIYIPPFSATLASHVPSMISMLISPTAAVMVGLGSSLGFLLILGPVVAARAFIHVIFGVVGAYLIKKGFSFSKTLLLVTPIHALGEALIVLPLGFDLYTAFVVVGVGTILHHLIDSAVAIGLVKVLSAGLSLSGKNF
ncbi:ECF transporter S component [Tepidanaerobacter sp. EBM-38]|jgi:niacin transporter|uniref:ECF transporter S component n=1 Tax=Tepidanaerobacter sp. EBM-38 TaxID=1918496 RepID=UPI000AE7CACB|nr:ECF transporter S component [Tepidanaerobacter sp. EBM-38]